MGEEGDKGGRVRARERRKREDRSGVVLRIRKVQVVRTPETWASL